MARSPPASVLLSMVEDIKASIEKDDASNTATRPDLLAKILRLRDAVETPQDSLLRIYSQVSDRRYSELWSLKSDGSTSAIAKCRTKGRCRVGLTQDHFIGKLANLRNWNQSCAIS